MPGFDILKQKEGPTLEFKEKIGDPDTLAKILIAFSNFKGGRLVIGVSDKTRDIVGIKEDQNIEEWIMNVATNNCVPIINPLIEHKVINKKTILIVHIFPGSMKPYYLKKSGIEDGTYLRVGSTNRKADRDWIQELQREARNISYDETAITSANISDLDEKLINDFQEKKRLRLVSPIEKISKEFLINIGAITKVNKDYYPTVAGLLLFSRNPQSFAGLSHMIVRGARFKGKNQKIFIDQLDVEGNLPKQIEETVRFVIKNTRLGGRIEGLRRKEIHEYPIEVIREITTNAIAHRNYSITGSAIRVAIYDDRLEFISPGNLPGGVSIENILDMQVSRNHIISKRLFDMGYIDEWGRGLNNVCEILRRRKLSPPIFEEKGLDFWVTIKGPGEKFMR